MTDAVAKTEITVVVEPPQEINVLVDQTVVLPVVTVEVPGIQGPSRADEPFDVDPVEIYLNYRGAIYGNDENQ